MNGKRDLIIAIDGPAGSGKSTTAKLVAKRLGYMHIDTGAMYRAVALKFLRLGVELTDSERVAEVLSTTTVSQSDDDTSTHIFLDGQDVSAEIRTPEISMWVGPVSENGIVRDFLVEWQRKLGEGGGVVLDGRDIGTVVFPNADVKIYMVAEIEARAKRRRKELLTRGVDQSIGDVQEAIATRDERDSSRAHSPLRKAEGAAEIDTTDLSIGDQVDLVIALAKKKLPSLTVH